MGWTFPWYTITDEFDADFGVDEWHGTNAFVRNGDRVFRTYFVNDRGDEALGSTWSYLDLTALGRQEAWEDSPEGYPQTEPYQWWNWHDEYGKSAGPFSIRLRLFEGDDLVVVAVARPEARAIVGQAACIEWNRRKHRDVGRLVAGIDATEL